MTMLSQDCHKVNHCAMGDDKRHNFFFIQLQIRNTQLRLGTRTLQLALPGGVESFPNRKSRTLGTRCAVPWPLLGVTKARDMEL